MNSRVINVEKTYIGWKVDGRWCATRRLREKEIKRIRTTTGKRTVRTPG